ncbi:Sucrase/ferredoxin-like-domain-containing protein [Blastocladiella britannica]|nr:Sucrase/ferredoxin-like-domain-containing protein [Blastocladiella britannica]
MAAAPNNGGGLFNSLSRRVSTLSVSSLSRGFTSLTGLGSKSGDGAEFPRDIEWSEACASCADPCADHRATMSARLAAKVATKAPLAGSIKPYTHHVVVCTGNTAHSWADHADRESPLLAAVEVACRSIQGDGIGRIMATVCDRMPKGGVQHFYSPMAAADGHHDEIECGDIMVFPTRKLITGVTAGNAKRVLEDAFFSADGSIRPVDAVVQAAEEAATKGVEGLPVPAILPLDLDHCVLVCSHKKRDSRCGEAGPILIDAFHDEIVRLEEARTFVHGTVGVFGTSHIGGHKFAGTLIVYSGGEGHFYGRVRTCDVPTLVQEQILHGKAVKHLWRGRVTPPEIARAESANNVNEVN